MQILWDGEVLASTSLGTEGEAQGPETFSIGVDSAGNVTVSWGDDLAVSASIPDDEWATADQSNWDFIIAGRSGGNGGEAYIDGIDLEASVVCFASGTMILTDNAQQAVETLQPGDLVMTRDRGAQPIRWIGSVMLDAATLQDNPNLRPIRIDAGALGNGTPANDLLVSPQHRVLVRSRIAQRMFGTDEVLVAARQLLKLDGVGVAEDLAEVEYVHFLFDRHEVVFSNGAETESLYTGAQAMKSVGPAARAEILSLFPELRDREQAPESARNFPSGRLARKLVARHRQNGKPLVM
ncbi:Hint domain-containing protein (plasmid) [Paracoccus seriniphilus]|nr:Hint domain-containing protein [Paracoccus seriniphilus]